MQDNRLTTAQIWQDTLVNHLDVRGDGRAATFQFIKSRRYHNDLASDAEKNIPVSAKSSACQNCLLLLWEQAVF